MAVFSYFLKINLFFMYLLKVIIVPFYFLVLPSKKVEKHFFYENCPFKLLIPFQRKIKPIITSPATRWRYYNRSRKFIHLIMRKKRKKKIVQHYTTWSCRLTLYLYRYVFFFFSNITLFSPHAILLAKRNILRIGRHFGIFRQRGYVRRAPQK